jgi:hypothetical protein
MLAVMFWALAVRYEATVHGAAINEWLDARCTAQPLAHRDVTMHHHGHEPGRS